MLPTNKESQEVAKNSVNNLKVDKSFRNPIHVIEY